MSVVIKDPRTEAKQRFSALFGLYENRLNGQRGASFHHLRKYAVKRMEELEFPGIKFEDWKYTSTSRLISPAYGISEAEEIERNDILPFLYKNKNCCNLIFVNGKLSKKLSDTDSWDAGVTILTIEEALAETRWEKKCRGVLEKLLNQSKDAFLPLNVAFAGKGLMIHTDRNIVMDRPIHILHVSTETNQPVLNAPVQLFFAEEGSQMTILESFHGLKGENSEAGFTACLNYFDVSGQAHVRYYKNQELASQDFMVHQTFADQGRDSVFSAFTADLGGKIVRNNLSVVHLEKNVLTNLYGVFLTDGEQHIDNQTFVDHAMPHCLSNELYKGILDGKSRGVFNGKVMVRPDAQKINAFQKNNILILSEQARMDSKPQLEIFADDVKCSHGATIGQMDESAVFYLRSRGLSETEARALLQLAFVQEVTEVIEDEDIRERMDDRISMKFRK